MELKIKAVSPKIGSDIPLPFYATPGSAAMDLHACMEAAVVIPAGGRKVIPTGIAIALPSPDYVALVLQNSGDTDFTIQPGERIAQLMVTPVVQAELKIVDELDDTQRGAGGFGSTGK